MAPCVSLGYRLEYAATSTARHFPFNRISTRSQPFRNSRLNSVAALRRGRGDSAAGFGWHALPIARLTRWRSRYDKSVWSWSPVPDRGLARGRLGLPESADRLVGTRTAGCRSDARAGRRGGSAVSGSRLGYSARGVPDRDEQRLQGAAVHASRIQRGYGA